MGKNMYILYRGPWVPKETGRDLVLHRCRRIKNPTWVGKKGDLWVPSQRSRIAVRLGVNIYIFTNVDWLVEIYTYITTRTR